MEDKWLNRVAFWILCIVPFFFVFIVGQFYGPVWFTICLLLYATIYRPIVHIFRLLKLKAIEEKDAWKFFIPFYQTKYIKTLWLG